MYPYVYGFGGYGYETFNYGGVVAIGALVAAILAIVLFFTFMSRKNEGKFTGTKGKIYDFLNFNKFYIEDVLRLIYVVSAAVITVVGVLLLFISFLTGLILITLGNVLLRVGYELIMMFIILCRKTVSIDRRLAMMNDDGQNGGRQAEETAQAEEPAPEQKQASYQYKRAEDEYTEAEAEDAKAQPAAGEVTVSAEDAEDIPAAEEIAEGEEEPDDEDDPDGEDEEIISQVYGADEKKE